MDKKISMLLAFCAFSDVASLCASGRTEVERSEQQQRYNRWLRVVKAPDWQGEVQDLLRKEGSENEVVDGFRRTPIHHAARAGNLAIVDILLQRGADINAASMAATNALYYAVLQEHEHMVRFLLDNGATKDSKTTALLRWTKNPNIARLITEYEPKLKTSRVSGSEDEPELKTSRVSGSEDEPELKTPRYSGSATPRPGSVVRGSSSNPS